MSEHILLPVVMPFGNYSNIIIVTGVHNAYIIRELLLAIHVSFGIGQHDPGFHRTAGIRALPDTRIPQSLRVHGPDDHVSEPRGARGQEIRSNA